MRILRLVLGHALKLAVTILLVALCGAALIRFTPGFGVDERELDAHLNRDTQERIRALHAQDSNLFGFLRRFATQLREGDLGYSTSLNRPVREIVSDRLSVTARELVFGLCGAAALALALATWGYLTNRVSVTSLLIGGSGLFLCVPAAVLGFAAVWLRLPTEVVLGATVFPHLFQYFLHLLESMRHSPHLLAAQCRGVAPARLHLVHAMLPCAPEGLATLGVGASIAFGASIPIEYVTGRPGIGQLAWQAASARDLPVLFVVTMLAAAFILIVNSAADITRALIGPVSQENP